MEFMEDFSKVYTNPDAWQIDDAVDHVAYGCLGIACLQTEVTQDHRVAGWARAVRSERLMLKQVKGCIC